MAAAQSVPVSGRCALPLCRLEAKPNVILHPLPEEEHLRQAWITFVHRCPGGGGRDWTPPVDQQSFLCSLHFAFNSYVYNHSSAVKKCLRTDAVPSVYPRRRPRCMARTKLPPWRMAEVLQFNSKGTETFARDPVSCVLQSPGPLVLNAGSVTAQSGHGTHPVQDSTCQGHPVIHYMESTPASIDNHQDEPVGKKQLHECTLCSKRFKRKYQLVLHLQGHNGGRAYRCDQCSSSFSQRSLLETHKRIHTGERPYRCDHCGDSFTAKGGLVRHQRTHTGERPYHCDYCGERFPVKDTLVKHLRRHTGERPYHCDYCDSSFPVRSVLVAHIRTHTGEKPFHCHLCPMVFTQRSGLVRHVRSHKGEKPFQCDLCLELFRHKRTLRHHKEIKHEYPRNMAVAQSVPVSARCALPLCRLEARPNVVLHPLPEDEPLRQAWITFVHRCPGGGGRDWTPPVDEQSFVCSLHFAFNSYVYRHNSAVKKCLRTDAVPSVYPRRRPRCMARSKVPALRRAEVLQFISKGTETFARDPASCVLQSPGPLGLTAGSVIAQSGHGAHSVQDSTYQGHPVIHYMESTPASISNHHEGPVGKKLYECTFCSKSFKRGSQLLLHLKGHTGDRAYHCDYCGSSFAQRSHLEAHERTHTGERPYHCDHCGDSFSTKGSLVRHQRTHTGKRPYHCDDCGKRFAVKDGLVKHLRSHTGERPYHCDYCDSSFAVRCVLAEHIRTHTGEKPFHCQLCPMTFTQRSGLVRHVRSHKGEKPFQCDLCPELFRDKRTLRHHKEMKHE
ncbi:uncharacterized protein LOC144108179 [Amblyomma americanum]